MTDHQRAAESELFRAEHLARSGQHSGEEIDAAIALAQVHATLEVARQLDYLCAAVDRLHLRT